MGSWVIGRPSASTAPDTLRVMVVAFVWISRRKRPPSTSALRPVVEPGRSSPRSERAHQGADRSELMVGERLLAFETRILPADANRLVRAGLVMRRMGLALHAPDRKEHARALLDYVRLVPADLRPDLERWIE